LAKLTPTPQPPTAKTAPADGLTELAPAVIKERFHRAAGQLQPGRGRGRGVV